MLRSSCVQSSLADICGSLVESMAGHINYLDFLLACEVVTTSWPSWPRTPGATFSADTEYSGLDLCLHVLGGLHQVGNINISRQSNMTKHSTFILQSIRTKYIQIPHWCAAMWRAVPVLFFQRFLAYVALQFVFTCLLSKSLIANVLT